MTDIELENRAEKYATKSGYIKGSPELRIIIQSYIAGAKENDLNWHDLRKDPNDLPDTGGKYFVCTGGDSFVASFDTKTNAFGYWYTVLGENLEVSDEMFETLEEIDEGEVIAWCELPLFKE